MGSHAELAAHFLSLHQQAEPFVLANPWDIGSARILEAAGYAALGTTSAGFAGTLGRDDGRVTQDEAIQHAAAVVAAVDIPVSADLENCFAHDPDGVTETARRAVEAGLAGFSIEDFSGNADDPIYEIAHAAERVAAAVEAAHAGEAHVVVTARAENFLHGRADLDDTIGRLQAFEAVGADVLYAPGPTDLEMIRQIVEAVSLPVNVLALPGAPSADQLARVGVKRISIGSGFAMVATSALADAAARTLESGTWDFWNDTSRFGMARQAWTL